MRLAVEASFVFTTSETISRSTKSGLTARCPKSPGTTRRTCATRSFTATSPSGERSEQCQLVHLKLAKLGLIREDRGQDVVAGHAPLWYLGALCLPRGCRARAGMRAGPRERC